MPKFIANNTQTLANVVYFYTKGGGQDAMEIPAGRSESLPNKEIQTVEVHFDGGAEHLLLTNVPQSKMYGSKTYTSIPFSGGWNLIEAPT